MAAVARSNTRNWLHSCKTSLYLKLSPSLYLYSLFSLFITFFAYRAKVLWKTKNSISITQWHVHWVCAECWKLYKLNKHLSSFPLNFSEIIFSHKFLLWVRLLGLNPFAAAITKKKCILCCVFEDKFWIGLKNFGSKI